MSGPISSREYNALSTFVYRGHGVGLLPSNYCDQEIAAGRLVRLLSFPAYDTPIGNEIGKALQGMRDYGAEVMQLLYMTNRYEWKPQIDWELSRGTVLICDRYIASSIAYGEAQGLDPRWLADVQRFLPAADLTILLDIPPEVAVQRKRADRDRYERDLELLTRVRASYQAQAASDGWVLLRGDRPKAEVSADVREAVASKLGLQ